MIDEYIKILGLPKNFKELPQAEQLVILNKAWKIYVVKNHPDVNKAKDSEENFKKANEAHEKLLELIKNGSIKYYESAKKEYKQGQSSNNTNTGDPLDDAINSYFEELREKERREEEARKRKFREYLKKTASLLIILFLIAVAILGLPLTLILIGNWLVGKAKRAI